MKVCECEGGSVKVKVRECEGGNVSECEEENVLLCATL